MPEHHPPRLELHPEGQIIIQATTDSTICVVNKDGTMTYVTTRPGELRVKFEQDGHQLWSHTFTYTSSPVEPVDPAPPTTEPTNHTNESFPVQRRPRGRPRLSQPAEPARITMDDDFA